MIIAVTLNGREAAAKGMGILREGGSALDAVEEAVKTIEDNPDDWSVGYGGFPNFAGVVELDASIADGRTLKAGAVAGLRRHRNPVAVARRVLEKTPHVMLVGEGADTFADGEGFPSEDLLTERMADTYRKLMAGEAVELWQRVEEESAEGAKKYGEKLMEVVKERRGWREVFCAELQGTCNAVAIDRNGDMASAVSTSGLAMKMPGRVGDTPIVGAGNYVDNRFGAAVCVGNGELVMRLCSARGAVASLEDGLGAREAAEKAVREVERLPDRSGGFHITVMTRAGDLWCASNIKDPEYYVMAEDDEAPRRVTGSFLKIEGEAKGTSLS
ncbi:MAG: isoaspartyl peptidase/L-asparaginase [Planctomycetota bacterium]|jgi:beta-aspartyl-peptidase (threonine type)